MTSWPSSRSRCTTGPSTSSSATTFTPTSCRPVLYACLHVYCDLHNDGGIGSGDRVGPYEIERMDFDAIVDRLPLRAAIQVVAGGQRPLAAWAATTSALAG